jgi:hypothetical protein
MEGDIATQIARLPSLSRRQLLDLWQRLYRRPAPEGLRREILVPFLAYRTQELALGGLKPSTLSQLRRIARTLETSAGTPTPAVRSKMKTGTRLLRNWGRETHEVVATESAMNIGARPTRASRKSPAGSPAPSGPAPPSSG